uniref:BTB domain-containing protein n=1 Tax=Strongyloides papillosus TaxID=174720 RepID=A0A0N5C9L0_STREA
MEKQIEFLPNLNHIISDPFHDLMHGIVGVVMYPLLIIVQIITDILNNELCDFILDESKQLGYYEKICTVFKPSMIVVPQRYDLTNFQKKVKLSVSGTQSLYILHSFYIVVCKIIEEKKDILDSISKMLQIKSLIECLLNLCYMTMDHEISVHEAIKITTTNVDHFYKV